MDPESILDQAQHMVQEIGVNSGNKKSGNFRMSRFQINFGMTIRGFSSRMRWMTTDVLLSRGVDGIVPKKGLKEKIEGGKKLRVYFGDRKSVV